MNDSLFVNALALVGGERPRLFLFLRSLWQRCQLLPVEALGAFLTYTPTRISPVRFPPMIEISTMNIQRYVTEPLAFFADGDGGHQPTPAVDDFFSTS
jgi:hypothetical protein